MAAAVQHIPVRVIPRLIGETPRVSVFGYHARYWQAIASWPSLPLEMVTWPVRSPVPSVPVQALPVPLTARSSSSWDSPNPDRHAAVQGTR